MRNAPSATGKKRKKTMPQRVKHEVAARKTVPQGKRGEGEKAFYCRGGGPLDCRVQRKGPRLLPGGKKKISLHRKKKVPIQRKERNTGGGWLIRKKGEKGQRKNGAPVVPEEKSAPPSGGAGALWEKGARRGRLFPRGGGGKRGIKGKCRFSVRREGLRRVESKGGF